MCHWLTGECVHGQLIHMELQSHPNSIGMEAFQDDLKHSAPIVSGTHSNGIDTCFHGCCWSKFCWQQVPDGALDACLLTYEHRETFSGHKSMLKMLYSNSTADVDNALVSPYEKILAHREIHLSISFHRCHLASSAKQISWAQSSEFSVHLHLTGRTWV